ncbi:MAG: hypothetical protein QNJ38_04190 [Prochloraceae cyanobacterium]|nr:hypothetical protein [Prochloraceae cyanobacterium]
MTGKIIDNGAPVALALIVPIALVLVVLYTAWPLILLVSALIVAWKFWENYQWQKLSQKINPTFNQLVRDNQGCLTHTDLCLKTDLSAAVAKKYLAKKAEELGAQRQNIENQGTIYYFLTANALGKMFAESQESEVLENQELRSPTAQPSSATETEVKSQPALSQISEPVDSEQKSDSETDSSHNADDITKRSLIQAELAKRLSLNSSTVGRRKSDPDFPEWSKSKDPQNIAWQYLSETKLFVAVVDRETESS